MHSTTRIALGLSLPLLFWSTPAPAAAVAINEAIEYQQMDGFGAAIADWLIPHNNDAAYIDGIINDLGISIIRLFMLPAFEPSNDNADTLTRGTFNTGGDVATQLAVVAKLHAAGLERVVLSTFSPPAWMKTNASEIGGELRPDMYGEFAEYYSEYVKLIQQAGLTVYAASPENEPAWAQSYSSCVYSPVQMRDIVIHLGRRFATDRLPVKIFWAEDLLTNQWQSYAGAVFASAEAKPYGAIVAVHHQGVGASEVSRYTSARARVESASTTPYSLGFWNSEISGYPDGWAGAFTMAQGFMVSLRDGKMNALLFGSPSIPASANQNREALMVDKQPTERYYVAKQFYRYIRPGAVMVGCSSDDTTVMAVAFVHKANRTMTVVLVNTGSSATTVSLQGSNLPGFTQIRTSQSETCDTVGTVTSTLTLPVSSITTLYATGYASAMSIVRGAPQRVSARRSDGISFAINGRKVPTWLQEARASGQRQSAGVYLVAGREHSGRLVAVCR
jgi:O-glycosyl hydrolase